MTEQFTDAVAEQSAAHEEPAGSSPRDGAEPAGSSPPANGETSTEVNPDLDTIEAMLTASEIGMSAIGPNLRDDAHDFLTAGLAYEKAHPAEAAKLAEKMGEDVELFALVFRFLAKQGREERLTGPTRKGNEMTEHYVPPTKRQQLQDRLDEICREHPVGTESYKSAKVQREVAALNSALYGDEPVTTGPRPGGI